MSGVINVTSQEQLNSLLGKRSKVFVFYGVSSCAGCTEVAPLFERVARRYSDKALFIHADVDRLGLSFTRLPIFIFYYRRERKDTQVGASTDRIKEFIGQGLKFSE